MFTTPNKTYEYSPEDAKSAHARLHGKVLPASWEAAKILQSAAADLKQAEAASEAAVAVFFAAVTAPTSQPLSPLAKAAAETAGQVRVKEAAYNAAAAEARRQQQAIIGELIVLGEAPCFFDGLDDTAAADFAAMITVLVSVSSAKQQALAAEVAAYRFDLAVGGMFQEAYIEHVLTQYATRLRGLLSRSRTFSPQNAYMTMVTETADLRGEIEALEEDDPGLGGMFDLARGWRLYTMKVMAEAYAGITEQLLDYADGWLIGHTPDYWFEIVDDAENGYICRRLQQ